jgi:hypothetical protein
MRGLAICKFLHAVTVQRLQRGDASEFNRPAPLGRQRQQLRRRGHRGHVVVGFWDGLAKVRHSLAQRAQLGTIGLYNRLGKTPGSRHNATPQKNQDSSAAVRIRSVPNTIVALDLACTA